MSYKLTEQDFRQLCNTSIKWKEHNWKEDHRYETIDDKDINYDFKMAYWIGKEYASVIFAKMFLTENSSSFQVLWDSAGDGEWLIITDYETNSWQSITSCNHSSSDKGCCARCNNDICNKCVKHFSEDENNNP